MTADDTSSSRFSYVYDWQAMSEPSAAAILDFWQREAAIGKPSEMSRRLSEVVLHAVDQDGLIAAVCTVYSAIHPQVGQPLYHYRCFVGRQWRSSLLLRTMIRHAKRLLGDYALKQDFPCVGMIVELENPRFRDALTDAPLWCSHGTCFVYIGKNARGHDMRLLYFPRAKLRRT